MKEGQAGTNNLFEDFVDRYGSSIFSALSKLTGLSDTNKLESMTIDVFVDLWNNNDKLFGEIRPAAFIYKVLLEHVFSYLKKEGREDHILLLRKILLIDPSYYLHIVEPDKRIDG